MPWRKHEFGVESFGTRWNQAKTRKEREKARTAKVPLSSRTSIARAQHSLTLLLQIGYSPRYLSRFMTGRFLPMVLGTVIAAMIVTIAGQVAASVLVLKQGLVLPAIPGLPVWAALVISTGILVLLVSRSISGAIKKQ